MNEREIENDLLELDTHLRHMSRRVTFDPHHKLRIREELMRRHREMPAVTSQRAAGMLLSRLTGTRRLTLVAPPALAVVMAIALFLSGVPFLHGNEGQIAQAAEDTRIYQALTQTVPTVRAWQWTIHRWTAGQGSSVVRLQYQTQQQRLYIRGHHVSLYVYSGNQWYLVPLGTGPDRGAVYRTPGYWQWQLGTLAQRLAEQRVRILRTRSLTGSGREGVQYALGSGRRESASATAWIDPASGLVRQLDLVVTRGNRVVERDRADYRYGST